VTLGIMMIVVLAHHVKIKSAMSALDLVQVFALNAQSTMA